MSRYGPFFYKNNFPSYPFFCNKFDCFLVFPNLSLQKIYFAIMFFSRCCSLISLLSICSNGRFFLSIRCVDYMCYNDYCGTSTPNILPKPLSAVPHIIENTKKIGVTLPRNLSSGLSASRSWLNVMRFQGSAPPQAPPTHRKCLRYDFRITMVIHLEMKRRKEEMLLGQQRKLEIGRASCRGMRENYSY